MDLPPPYRVNSLGLVLTMRCNAQCSHCCFECEPHRRERMQSERAAGYIEAVAELGCVHALTFTGGEPFTEYPSLRVLLSIAGEMGLRTRIVSNGFWASTPARARARLQPLVEHGLTSLNLSFDAAHEAYVKPGRIRNAVLAALELGLSVDLAYATAGDPSAADADRIFAALDLSPDLPVRLLHGYIQPAGRANRNWRLDELALVDGDSEAGERLHAPCQHVVRDPAIMPNGDLVACCGTTVASRDGYHPRFVVGNLNETPLGELVERLETDPLYMALMVEGPWYLYHRLYDRWPQSFPRDRFVSACDVCAQVTCNSVVTAELHGLLEEQGQRMFLKKMLLEAAREERSSVR